MISCKKLLEQFNIELIQDFQDREIRSLNTLQDSTKEELSFVESEKFIEDLKNTKAGVVLIEKHLLPHVPTTTTPVVVQNPYFVLAKISQHFIKPLIRDGEKTSVGKNCHVMENVTLGVDTTIGDNCVIMAGAYIGNGVKIGSNTTIYPNVVIYDNTVIGDNVTIHAGSAIGIDGFGYIQDRDFTHHKIHHIGNVHIESNVEIGANATIDRSVFGTTRIKQGSKIDNLVLIAHNCEIGEKCAIAGQTGIAGSSIIGNKVLFGAQGGVAGHLSIGDGAVIAARGGVTKSIKGGAVYAGFPLFERKKWLRIQGKIARLLEK